MRFDAKLVHPSIFKATDALAWSGKLYGEEGSSSAAVAHQQIWLKEYGAGCAAYIVSSAVLFSGGLFFAHELAKPWKALLMLGIMLTIAATGYFAYRRNLRRLTSTELAALLPMLDLPEAQRAYAETLVALDRSGRSVNEVEDAMRALNALLDEDARLVAMREQYVGSSDREDRQSLLEERNKLAARAEAANDIEAKRSFEQSIVLLDERLAAFDAQGGQVERIDAHRELLRQALLATRDAARHSGTVSSNTDLATDSLRSAVALARAQSQETELALAELNAI